MTINLKLIVINKWFGKFFDMKIQLIRTAMAIKSPYE